MYRFYEEKNKIRQIQKYLFVVENGNYDEETRAAVERVQKRYNADQSGEIDFDTFRLIYAEYQDKTRENKLKSRFPDTCFPLRIHTYSPAALELNRMLIELSDFYGIQTRLRYTDYYGEQSERVLKEISNIYGIERSNGEVDGYTYLMIEKDFNMIRRISD